MECAQRFNAKISVQKDGADFESVSATSIMGLMMLAAAYGDSLILEASGEEAESAITTLTDLIENKFGEE